MRQQWPSRQHRPARRRQVGSQIVYGRRARPSVVPAARQASVQRRFNQVRARLLAWVNVRHGADRTWLIGAEDARVGDV
jgi:hypothetical protein